MTDFSTITACGECCIGCPKKLDGRCPGCIEADGRVPEWAESGRCKVHACARDHHVQFCGLCAEFPCAKLLSLISWNPDIVEKMTVLRNEYYLNRSIERMKDYLPANYMAKNIGTLTFSNETLDRFEKLFNLINSKFN